MANPFASKENIERKSLEQPEKSQEKSDKSDAQLSKITENIGETLEGVEIGNEQISENVSEGKKVYMGGGSGSTSQTAQTALARQIQIPSLEVMRKEVAVEIKNQIRVLEHEAKKMSKGNFSAFALTGVVSKIRELKEILGNLAYATADSLKGWWLKFVKNISI